MFPQAFYPKYKIWKVGEVAEHVFDGDQPEKKTSETVEKAA